MCRYHTNSLGYYDRGQVSQSSGVVRLCLALIYESPKFEFVRIGTTSDDKCGVKESRM
jgi:hypothetical protein